MALVWLLPRLCPKNRTQRREQVREQVPKTSSSMCLEGVLTNLAGSVKETVLTVRYTNDQTKTSNSCLSKRYQLNYGGGCREFSNNEFLYTLGYIRVVNANFNSHRLPLKVD